MDVISFISALPSVSDHFGGQGGHVVLIGEYVKPLIWDCTQGGTDVLLYTDKNLKERVAELTSVKPTVCLFCLE